MEYILFLTQKLTMQVCICQQLKVAYSRKAFNFWAGKSHPPFLAQIFYPGVLYFENLDFGALFHLKKKRQNSNFLLKITSGQKIRNKNGG